MLYYEFACNFSKMMKKDWKQRDFIKENGSFNFEKINNYLNLIVPADDICLKFYELQENVLKGVCKISFDQVCKSSPKNILEAALSKFFNTLNLMITVDETTLKKYLKKSQWAESLIAIRSPRTGEIMKIENSYLTFFNCNITEKLIRKSNLKKDEMIQQTNTLFISDDFGYEIQRIYDTGNLKNFYGHPLHYVIYNENIKRRKHIIKLLSEALYANGRIKSRRITVVNGLNFSNFEYDEDNFEDLLKDNEGGTVVIGFDKNYEENKIKDDNAMKVFWNKIFEYKDKVLFIFLDIPDNINFYSKAKKNIKLMVLSYGFIYGIDAKIYIKDVINESGYKDFSPVFDYDSISDEEKYRIEKIDELIKSWQEEILNTQIFKLYN